MYFKREKLLTPSWKHRRGKYYAYYKKYFQPRGIALHWTLSPRATAEDCWNWFENITKRCASAHYSVDNKEVLQMIPTDEFAFHVGSHVQSELSKKYFMPDPNLYLIGIELCHPDYSGKFEEETLHNASALCANLCEVYGFHPFSDVFRHSDITLKGLKGIPKQLPCPRWFVEEPDEWDNFRESIKEKLVAGW